MSSACTRAARIFSKAPLVICVSLLIWEEWTCFYSITISYFLVSQRDYGRALLFSLTQHIFWLPAVLSLFVVVARGPGYVPLGRRSAWEAQEVKQGAEINGALRSRPASRQSDHSQEDETATLTADEGQDTIEDVVSAAAPYIGLLSSPQAAYAAAAEQSLTTKANGGVRFCRKCYAPKPDRTHHCRICGRCVLKMDHHCGIISTCIGHHNYKAFLLFLGYTVLTCLHAAALSGYTLFHFVQTIPDSFLLTPVNWAMMLMLGGIFGLVLSGFSMYHFYLVRSNRTTIENMETTRIKLGTYNPDEHGENGQDIPNYRGDYSLSWEERRALRRAATESHIYDLGWRRNLDSVFGTDRQSDFMLHNLLSYLSPFTKAKGDGQSFDLNHSNVAKLQEIHRQIRAAKPRSMAYRGD